MESINPIQASETYVLRHEVLRPHQPPRECEYPGDWNHDTLHLGYFVGQQLVSVASCYRESHPLVRGRVQFRLRGMATHPEHRRKGYGASLIQSALVLLEKKGGDVLWCNARVVALEFYRRLGFQIEGEEFEIPPIGPHYVMHRKIPG